MYSCNNEGKVYNSNSLNKDIISPKINDSYITEGCKGLVLNIKNSTIPSNLDLIITNNSNYHATYGISWNLYYLKQKEWIECIPEFGFVDIGGGSFTNEKDTFLIPINQFKSPLKSGMYKITKTISLNKKECILTKKFKMEF